MSASAVTEDTAVLSKPFWIAQLGIPSRSLLGEGGQTHHISRYPRRKLIRVCFYGKCTEFEQETAKEVVERNRLNLDYEKADVVFFENIEQLKEVGL